LLLAAIAGLWCAGAADPVRPGIDVLLSDSLHLVRGRRVGLVTNQTGVDRNGRDDVTRLREAGVALVAIFTPEHGFRGALDVENIGHGVDSATGLPIFSLYGNVRAPTDAMLRGVDVLLVDLQDIGARTYTYISTALLTLRAAARVGIPLIILDRPNPIGGVLVQGPALDTALGSFIGMLPVPLRHGMTLGELVQLGQEALGIEGTATVVPAAGWRRDVWFDQTGLPWIRPSPNMPDLESATHYPGTVLFEATNLSVGRGTPIAFQVVGAPWLDAAQIAAELQRPGVAVSDTLVTPVDPPDRKFGGQPLPAVRLRVTDREQYDPTSLAVHLLAAIRRRHGDSLRLDTLGFDRRTGDPAVRQALDRGTTPDSIVMGWSDAIRRFLERRSQYLLY
jgi:uncharacterized protein YbbC (DUF1343 family)